MNTHSNTTDEQTITLYKYIKAEYLPDFLSTGYLKVSAIGEVNDPFEYAPCFNPEDDYMAMVREHFGVDGSTALLSKLKDTFEEWRLEWENKLSKGGVKYISFSTRCSNPLMWGHYADNHKGVCLVFRFPVKKIEQYFPQAQMAEIIYSSTRVSYLPMILAKPLDINKEKLYQLFLHLCSCTKSSEWEYEKEIRLFLNRHKHLRQRNSISMYGDVRKALNGIILGINYRRNEDKIKSNIDSAIKRNASHLQIVQATQSNKEFLVETGNYKDATPNDYKSWFNGFETTDAINLYKDILKLGIHFQQRFLKNLFKQYGYNIDFPKEFTQEAFNAIMKKDKVR